MKPNEFVALLKEARACAILRTQVEGAALPAMEAAVRGGFKVIEFTLNSHGALDLIRDFSSRPGLVVGAGTVLTREDAKAAVEAGASFLVSPVVDLEVIQEAKSREVAIIPGCATPTEMLHAFRAGASLQKLFPGSADGPNWIRRTLGPMPFLKIVPTSIVDGTNVAAFLEAGAFAVGFGVSLFAPHDLEAARFERVEERAKAFLKAANAKTPLRA